MKVYTIIGFWGSENVIVTLFRRIDARCAPPGVVTSVKYNMTAIGAKVNCRFKIKWRQKYDSEAISCPMAVIRAIYWSKQA